MADPLASPPPRGLARLRAVLGAPGAPALLVARSIGSLPIGMAPLGILLLLRASGRSYALAGIADGAYALGVAGSSPLLGRLVDRAGMGRVLAPLAFAFPALLAAVAVAGSSGVPAVPIVALALAAGAALPPLGACMRVLWPMLVSGAELRSAAFLIDATLQEFAFIGGPPLLAAVVALASPLAALLGAAALGGVGTLLFVARARGRHAPTAWAGGALRSGRVRRMLLTSAVLGGSFGALEIAMPAFCERHGARPAAGVMLAAIALGSACGGAAVGVRAARAPAERRLVAALLAYAALAVPLLFAPSIPAMVALAFVSGTPIAPAFGGAYELLDRFTVPGAITETFAWNTTAIYAGASLGTAVGGALIAAGGYRSALGLAAALAAAAGVLVALSARRRRFARA